MMKTIARIYKWIIISVFLQVVILAYLNFIYLGDGGAVKATMYQPEDEAPVSREVKIPAEASGIKASFNGLYAAYTMNGKLEIFDIKNRRSKKTIDTGKDILSYYRWLPDRNMIIYSSTSIDKGKVYVNVITYDVDSGVERSYPKVSGLPDGSGVEDIELSPLTNIVYVKVKVSDSQARIYRYNIMDNLKYIMSTGINTVIKETIYSDNLVFQDGKNKIYVKDGRRNTTKLLPFKSKMALLGIDSEDKVYAGELNKENKVYKIYFGKLDDRIDRSWIQLQLDKPALPQNIIITPGGAVYKLSEDDKVLYGIDSDRRIELTGEFVEMLEGYIVTKDNKRLKLTVIKSE